MFIQEKKPSPTLIHASAYSFSFRNIYKLPHRYLSFSAPKKIRYSLTHLVCISRYIVHFFPSILSCDQNYPGPLKESIQTGKNPGEVERTRDADLRRLLASHQEINAGDKEKRWNTKNYRKKMHISIYMGAWSNAFYMHQLLPDLIVNTDKF